MEGGKALNRCETSMLVVKPDGVAKGLVDEIRKIISGYGLVITKEISKVLEAETVVQLYSEVDDIKDRDYFPQLVEFMSSGPVHIFIVRGENAVGIIRKIIGKRDPASGIRQRWAEDIIRNVAHGPHTSERAKIEISILTEMED